LAGNRRIQRILNFDCPAKNFTLVCGHVSLSKGNPALLGFENDGSEILQK
jgi:hypothetical protein